MGMPITIEIVDANVNSEIFAKIFSYFESVDKKFSTYKNESEISKINRGEIASSGYSEEMKEIFALSEETKKITNGYFDIYHNGKYDPSGIVKGWAIFNASKLLKENGFKNFYIEAGGDIQVSGRNAEGKVWTVGIRNPFNKNEIVKTLYIKNMGIATSGTYERGQHIYNPKNESDIIDDIVCLTVIGPNIYEADRFATPAFAMGKNGIEFIERLDGFEGYMIDKNGIATMTSGFNKYTKQNA